MEKKQIKKKKVSTKKNVKKKKLAFTLIELLAVIVILGVLMLVAIPSVTAYINNSRKDAYTTTAKQIIKGATNLVNSGDIDVYDPGATYYIPNTCIPLETGGDSPYGGEFSPAYVLVTYDNDSFSYYWMSRDENGIGVKTPTISTKLNSKLIESGIKEEDITPNIGVDGRETIIEFNEDCSAQKAPVLATKTINGETGEENTYKLCRRATELHTSICKDTNTAYYCNKYEGYNNPITFGFLGNKGTLSIGDAFDCDVNGDGVYNSENERFYFISYYYDTYSKSYDNKYAALIYYGNVYNGSLSNSRVAYHSVPESWHGPTVAYTHLPSTSQWPNVSLKTNKRQILNMNGEASISGHSLPEFEYTNKAARLLTYREYYYKCYNERGKCKFLLENTSYVSGAYASSYWFETPYYNDVRSAFKYDATNISLLGYVVDMTYTAGVRPVIDVPIINIEI